MAPNVYDYYSVTLLQFQERDVFGVYIPQLCLYEERESGPLNL